MKEKIFIKKAKEKQRLEEFLHQKMEISSHGQIEIQYTPVGTKIIIHTISPGLAIGAGGERIKETTKLIKNKFELENPQIDVQKIENKFLNPPLIANEMASRLEHGDHFKRLGNFYLMRILESGAIGCEIVFSGKFRGQRSFKERFIEGYLKKCGEPSRRDVLKGFATADTKLGSIGVSVKIMIRHPGQPIEEEMIKKLKERKSKLDERSKEIQKMVKEKPKKGKKSKKEKTDTKKGDKDGNNK